MLGYYIYNKEILLCLQEEEEEKGKNDVWEKYVETPCNAHIDKKKSLREEGT